MSSRRGFLKGLGASLLSVPAAVAAGKRVEPDPTPEPTPEPAQPRRFEGQPGFHVIRYDVRRDENVVALPVIGSRTKHVIQKGMIDVHVDMEVYPEDAAELSAWLADHRYLMVDLEGHGVMRVAVAGWSLNTMMVDGEVLRGDRSVVYALSEGPSTISIHGSQVPCTEATV